MIAEPRSGFTRSTPAGRGSHRQPARARLRRIVRLSRSRVLALVAVVAFARSRSLLYENRTFIFGNEFSGEVKTLYSEKTVSKGEEAIFDRIGSRRATPDGQAHTTRTHIHIVREVQLLYRQRLKCAQSKSTCTSERRR